MLIGKPNGDTPRFNNVVMGAVPPGTGMCDSTGDTGITVTSGSQPGNETLYCFGTVMLRLAVVSSSNPRSCPTFELQQMCCHRERNAVATKL